MKMQNYTAPLGALRAKYTRQDTSKGPFQDISIDPFNPLNMIEPFEGSRSRVKNYPLVVRCLNSGALEVLLMEGMETKDIILYLLKLELRHGLITMISRDSGTNLLTNNFNPKLASGDEI